MQIDSHEKFLGVYMILEDCPQAPIYSYANVHLAAPEKCCGSSARQTSVHEARMKNCPIERVTVSRPLVRDKAFEMIVASLCFAFAIAIQSNKDDDDGKKCFP